MERFTPGSRSRVPEFPPRSCAEFCWKRRGWRRFRERRLERRGRISSDFRSPRRWRLCTRRSSAFRKCRRRARERWLGGDESGRPSRYGTDFVVVPPCFASAGRPRWSSPHVLGTCSCHMFLLGIWGGDEISIFRFAVIVVRRFGRLP